MSWHEVGTLTCVVLGLNVGMTVRELAATIELEGVGFCGLWLMDLTEEIRHGRQPFGYYEG